MDKQIIEGMKLAIVRGAGVEAIDFLNSALDALESKGIATEEDRKAIDGLKRSIKSRLGFHYDPREAEAEETKPYRSGYVALLYHRGDKAKTVDYEISTVKEFTDLTGFERSLACNILLESTARKRSFKFGRTVYEIEWVRVGD